MFEIYREADYNRAFRYVFYTELEEHGRDAEIAKAAGGEMVYSGFFDDATKEQARAEIAAIVDELNDLDDDAPVDRKAIERRLQPFFPAS